MTNEREFMIEIGVSFDNNMLENEEEYYTWQQPEIVSDEYGNTKIKIVTKTGFENEGS